MFIQLLYITEHFFLIIMKCSSFCMEKSFVFNSISSDIKIFTPAFLYLAFMIYPFQPIKTLILLCLQATYSNVLHFIYSVNICLLIRCVDHQYLMQLLIWLDSTNIYLFSISCAKAGQVLVIPSKRVFATF